MIKKILALLAASLFTSTALADYQHEVARRDYCKMIGKISEQTYMARVLKEPKQKYLDLSKAQLDANDRNAEILRYAIDYGYDKATGLDDSHMGAWAFCMDKSQ